MTSLYSTLLLYKVLGEGMETEEEVEEDEEEEALPAEMVNFGTKILEGFNKYFWTSYDPNSGVEQKF